MQIPSDTNVYSYFELFRWLAVIKLFEGTRGNITYGGVVTGNDTPNPFSLALYSFCASVWPAKPARNVAHRDDVRAR